MLLKLGRLSNWDYASSAPTGEWNGRLGIARQLPLTAGGLVQRPAAPVALTTVDGERRLRIRLFMDTCAVEVFGGDGRVTISSLLPSPHSRPCP
ncbi:GH32 C-terminal domain-containing protein [Streptomyces sp. NPDC001890]|uniref:GH32 C-terminal domain-containing protein n=1 Tax=Streptomyces sp. NPDC001890 TaxID=3364620 RepID=UPI00368B2C25